MTAGKEECERRRGRDQWRERETERKKEIDVPGLLLVNNSCMVRASRVHNKKAKQSMQSKVKEK